MATSGETHWALQAKGLLMTTNDTQRSAFLTLPWKKLLIAVLAIAALVFVYRLLPINEWINSFQNWVQGYGVLGWFIFIAVYAVTCFAMLPGSFLTLAAGVIWGIWAFPIVVVGATLGSAISFVAARHWFHDKVQEKVSKYPRFKAINEAIADDGWKVVGLLRLSPALPFSLQNWFLGITPVGFWPSQIATFFGIMPGTLLYVWVGSLGGQAANSDMSLAKYIIGGVGILATLVVTVLVTKKANAKLKQYKVS